MRLLVPPTLKAVMLMAFIFLPSDGKSIQCLSGDNITCVGSIKEENLFTGRVGESITVYQNCGAQCEACERLSLNLTNVLSISSVDFVKASNSFKNLTAELCSHCHCDTTEIFISFKSLDSETLGMPLHVINFTVVDKLDPLLRFSESKWNRNPWDVKVRTNPLSKRSALPTSTVSINVTYSAPDLLIVSPNIAETYTIINIRSETFLASCTASPCSFPIPQDLLVVDTVMKVTIFYQDTFYQDFEFPIDKEDTCTIVECTFICKEYFTHFVCYSGSTQIFIAVSFILSCLTFLIILVLIGLRLYRSDLLSRFYQWISISKLKSKHPEIDADGEQMTSIESSDNSEPMVIIPPRRFSNLPRAGTGLNPSVMLAVLCLSLLASANAECIGTTTISSEIVECIHGTESSSSLSNCRITLNIQAVLPFLYSSVCVTVVDKVSNQVLGDITITLEQVRLLAHLSHSYYTSDWSLQTASLKACAVSTELCSTGGCTSANPDDFSMFSGPVTFYPGVTQCRTTCGCAGCGCFYCEDACLYSRYAFKPEGPAYVVSSIEGITSQPVIRVQINLGNFHHDGYLDFTASTLSIGNFSFVNVGEISAHTSMFGDKHVIASSSDAYLFEAAMLGAPSYGLPGDLQTTYHEWLEQSPYFFAFPPNVIPGLETSNEVVYNLPESGISTMIRLAPSLPLSLDNIMWAYTPQALVGMDLQPNPVMVYISTAQPVSIQLMISKVCPVLMSIKVNGCYQCHLGGSLSIVAKSTCDVGSAILKVITDSRVSVFVSSVTLNNSETTIVIPFVSLDQSIQGVLDLSWGDIHSNLTFSGVLSDPPLISSSQINFTGSPYGTVPLDEQTLSDWWNSLTGPLSIAKYVVLVVITVVVAIVAMAVLVWVIKVAKNSYYAYKVI